MSPMEKERESQLAESRSSALACQEKSPLPSDIEGVFFLIKLFKLIYSWAAAKEVHPSYPSWCHLSAAYFWVISNYQ